MTAEGAHEVSMSDLYFYGPVSSTSDEVVLINILLHLQNGRSKT